MICYPCAAIPTVLITDQAIVDICIILTNRHGSMPASVLPKRQSTVYLSSIYCFWFICQHH
jgi:hypothetical protein